jgi:hypothetical protein
MERGREGERERGKEGGRIAYGEMAASTAPPAQNKLSQFRPSSKFRVKSEN